MLCGIGFTVDVFWYIRTMLKSGLTSCFNQRKLLVFQSVHSFLIKTLQFSLAQNYVSLVSPVLPAAVETTQWVFSCSKPSRVLGDMGLG